MNPPSVYTYSQIVDAAFDLLRDEGWDAVSTRAIAKRLGSSTMPIYSNVGSVDELEVELRRKARDLLKEYQGRPYTEEVLLNLAFGYIVFARDEKHLFRFLYLDRPDRFTDESGSSMRDVFMEDFGPESPAGAALMALDDASQKVLIQYTWIFTHGLAMLVNSGSVGSTTDRHILRLLMGAGEAFYLWATREDEGQ